MFAIVCHVVPSPPSFCPSVAAHWNQVSASLSAAIGRLRAETTIPQCKRQPRWLPAGERLGERERGNLTAIGSVFGDRSSAVRAAGGTGVGEKGTGNCSYNGRQTGSSCDRVLWMLNCKCVCVCVDLKWMLSVCDSFVCLLLGGSQNWGPTRWQVAGNAGIAGIAFSGCDQFVLLFICPPVWSPSTSCNSRVIYIYCTLHHRPPSVNPPPPFYASVTFGGSSRTKRKDSIELKKKWDKILQVLCQLTSEQVNLVSRARP